MTRRAGIAAATLLVASSVRARPDRPFEDCLVPPGGKAAATAAHAGKTYELQFADCADTFQTDPERYAQLYDALQEMGRAGAVSPPPRSPSLVPS